MTNKSTANKAVLLFVDLLHCFDRISRRGVYLPFRGVQPGSKGVHFQKGGFKVNDWSILLKYVPSQLYNERKEGFQQAG